MFLSVFLTEVHGFEITQFDFPNQQVVHESDTNAYYILCHGQVVTNVTTPIDMALGQENSGQLQGVQSNQLSFYCVLCVGITNPLGTDTDGIDDVYELRTPPLDPFNTNDALLDFDADELSNLFEYQRGGDPNVYTPLTTVHSSPADGEGGIAVTRETVIYFPNPLASNAVIDGTIFHADFGGQTLTGRIHVASSRTSATLFYDDPLPLSSRIRVTVAGDTLSDVFGRGIDADADGATGGITEIEFDTLSLTIVSNTIVCGRVFASEQIQVAGTNQWVNNPLEGVTVTVDGLESNVFAVTDNLGDFRLTHTPVGRFFVHINGVTASNNSAGYYPNVGKTLTSVATQDVNVGNFYLPLVATSTLQEVSQSNATVVSFPDAVTASNPAWAGVQITVPPGSLQYDDGAFGSQVGIAPVPPDRLPGQLPDGLDFPLVITVQTDGAANFDEPAPVCFPNLPEPGTTHPLPPGAKTALWSFNHDAGRWEVVGPMTITADGTLACTDPGVGILASGWHGTQGGSSGGGGGGGGGPDGPPPPPCKGPCGGGGGGGDGGSDTDPVYLFSGEQYLEVTDLEIKGRGMDFVWSRKYRSETGPNTVVGNGWDFSYNHHLIPQGRGVRVCDRTGRDDLYSPRSDGMFGFRGFLNALAVIDITDPAVAFISRQVSFIGSARAVTAAGGIAFAGIANGPNSKVCEVDLDSGEILQTLPLIYDVHDVVLSGDYLYVLVLGTLHVVNYQNGSMQIVRSVSSPGTASSGSGRMRLFVGNGIAYAVHRTGYNTIDINGPVQPFLVTYQPTSQFGWKHMVVNASGLGLAAVSPNSTLDGPHNISLYDVSNPINAVFCTNHLGQKELQKSLDAPSGCACVFLQPFASKAFAQKSHV
ncbi:MAG: hypothetical protein GKR87_13850 [Kiritimatiellae bacterium]|nr:hypothetical protein [Kiritimatiellia bacterium]